MGDMGLATGDGLAFDLGFAGGDIVVKESTAEHQRQLVLCDKGDWKQNPLVGVGVFNYLNDEGTGDLVREIAQQWSGDGMDVQGVNVDSQGRLIANGQYNSYRNNVPGGVALPLSSVAGSYVVTAGQSMIDVALMATGTLESLMMLAVANDVPMCATIDAGTVMVVPAGVPYDERVLNYWVANGIDLKTSF